MVNVNWGKTSLAQKNKSSFEQVNIYYIHLSIENNLLISIWCVIISIIIKILLIDIETK